MSGEENRQPDGSRPGGLRQGGPQQDERRHDERRMAREKRRAERRELLASGPPSPCVSVCQMDPFTGYCLGCLRTIDEIRDWIISTPAEREAILARIAERREKAGS